MIYTDVKYAYSGYSNSTHLDSISAMDAYIIFEHSRCKWSVRTNSHKGMYVFSSFVVGKFPIQDISQDFVIKLVVKSRKIAKSFVHCSLPSLCQERKQQISRHGSQIQLVASQYLFNCTIQTQPGKQAVNR